MLGRGFKISFLFWEPAADSRPIVARTFLNTKSNYPSARPSAAVDDALYVSDFRCFCW